MKSRTTIPQTPKLLLEELYLQAEEALAQKKLTAIEVSIEKEIREIIERSEASKGVVTVLITSIVYKLLHSDQDIRRHQTSIEGGYSGRTFDTHHITPFLKQKRFPSMAESGWLTRSLEQKVPYDRAYTGAIRPSSLKEAFLNLIDYTQRSSQEELCQLLTYIFVLLIQQREKNQLRLARPRNLTIEQILRLLNGHFENRYKFEGASRLPTLAIYAIYQVLMQEVKRFEGKQLLPLEKHNSADRRSGRLGDIDVLDEGGEAFEAVEVKLGIPISCELLETAYEKLVSTRVQRYYMLSTYEPEKCQEQDRMAQRILEIKNTHGCQLVVNGIYSTIKYYLRLLQDTSLFVERYVTLLEADEAIKYEHRLYWNTLIQNLKS